MSLYIVILIAYAFFLSAIGLFLSSRVRGSSDYYIASRSLTTGLLFSTLLAANIGAGSTVGATGLGYRCGLSAWWWVGSAGIGSLILALTVGPKLWTIAAREGFYTVGDYLEYRYSRSVRLLIAILIWLGALAVLSGQLIAIAWILHILVGAPKWLGCLIGGSVVITYSSLGGLYSTVWVNLVQVVVKIGGFCLATSYALSSIGNWQGLQYLLRQEASAHPVTEGYFHLCGSGFSTVFSYLILLVPSFIVSPGILQKVYGARNPSVVRKAILMNATGLFLFAMAPPLLGMVTRTLEPSLGNSELALPFLMLHGMPLWLGGLTLAAVFSAELSAADAVLAMLSSSFVNDFIKPSISPNLADSRFLAITRTTSLLAVLLGIACAIALPSVISALQIFYGLLTVALLVPVVAGLYWSRTPARAALASIISGISTTSAIHLKTNGAGFGILSPAACGVLLAAFTLIAITMASGPKQHCA